MPQPDKNQPQNPASPQRAKLPPALQGVRPPAPGVQAGAPRPSAAAAPQLRATLPAAAPAPRAAPPTPGYPARTSTPNAPPNRQHLADALSQTAWDAAR